MFRKPLDEAVTCLEEIVDRARLDGQPTTLTNDGEDVAVIVPMEQYEQYQRLREAEQERIAADVENTSG